MTRTLGRHHQRFAHPGTAPAVLPDAGARARDWAEIQERMLVPLYEAVYERLEVRKGTRVLGLGCGSGLALLLAAARGARVTGVDSDAERLALARERLRAERERDGRERDGRERDGRADRAADAGTLLPVDRMADAAPGPGRSPYDLITAFQPIGSVAGDAKGLGPALGEAIPLARRGTPVVLAGWGPPERCATDGVLRIAGRLSERPREDARRRGHRDDLEEIAARAGLKPDGSGRVACPFGYADQESAVRGLLSTGVFDGAIRTTNRRLVEKEIGEALHPHLRHDGTVWMPNVFRYLIARTP
ncbi:methyltransferase domain-containing protein [Streptomyces sp. 35G-GA-8]|uniref:methyltransferase domain-containing protein n=1 Tax=Streptomyces sp. 35G-GA-8 TaxID=2939434 RepID=UPI00201FA3C1|nr:methyltransferase domain-containing protein [Streptomyces sp. 35G-GA-8]MCL7381838.1 methyltransferase domain-containing protein [Streptomyces sp. 35G-GA-8]